MNEKKNFIWRGEWSDLTSDLSLEQLGLLLRAVQDYNEDKDYDLNGDKEVKMAFRFIAAAIDRDRNKYEQICQKRAEAGKRGRAKQMEQSGQLPTNANKSGQKHPNINDITEQSQSQSQSQSYTPHEGCATLSACAREGEGKDDFDPLEAYGELHNVKLAPSQYRHLLEAYGKDQAQAAIDELSCKIAEGSYETNDHYATLLYWLKYRRRMDAGRVTMSSAHPTHDTMRIAWDALNEQEQQEYLDTHGGKLPWEQ